jgi:superoxide dismutase, Cu-Zn family
MRNLVAVVVLSLPALALGTGCYKVVENTVAQDGGQVMMMPADSGPAMMFGAKTILRDKTTLQVGRATFTELPDGTVDVLVELTKTSTGPHGLHIHANGACDVPDFASAGGHFNPTMMMHGSPSMGGHHAGDLGNIFAMGAHNEATGTIHFVSHDISVRPDSMVSILNKAIILHGKQDDLMTQPSGNSGPRIGCGVIVPTGADEVPFGVADAGMAPPNANVAITGKVIDLAGNLGGGGGGGGGGMMGTNAVGGASVLAYGVNPPIPPAISSADPASLGMFMMQLPQNGKTILRAEKTGYNTTYEQVTVGNVPLADVRAFLAPAPYISGLALTFGADLNAPFACHGPPEGGLNPADQCVYGIVIGQILDDGTAGAGVPTPVAGILATEISVKGPSDAVWFQKGPYALTATGGASRAQTETALKGLFATFVEIPATAGTEAIDFKIAATHAGTAGTRYFGPTLVKAFRPYGVTWSTIAESGAPAPPPPPGGIDFDTQIYPMFLQVAQGGFGCQGCHTSLNGATPAAGMDLSGGPGPAYTQLDPMLHPTRVDTANPPASLVLERPLYKPATQDHPIFAWASTQDPAYQIILTWIQQGGRRGAAGPPPAFTDVLAIIAKPAAQGGAGCVACHSGATPPAGFAVDGAPELVYAALTQQPATDRSTGETTRIDKTMGNADKSLVLIKPLLDNNTIVHPVKLFSSTTDQRYHTIYRWIVAGFPGP